MSQFPGHTLVVPFRLIPDWWSATESERLATFDLVDVVRDQLLDDAGQTVPHLHVHVIPRYVDPSDPPGAAREATIKAVTGQ